jgi:hypothetical protein
MARQKLETVEPIFVPTDGNQTGQFPGGLNGTDTLSFQELSALSFESNFSSQIGVITPVSATKK